jgi:hypothetical protein
MATITQKMTKIGAPIFPFFPRKYIPNQNNDFDQIDQRHIKPPAQKMM